CRRAQTGRMPGSIRNWRASHELRSIGAVVGADDGPRRGGGGDGCGGGAGRRGGAGGDGRQLVFDGRRRIHGGFGERTRELFRNPWLRRGAAGGGDDAAGGISRG